MTFFHPDLPDADRKRLGLLRQRDGATCLRLAVTGGHVSSAALRTAAEVAAQFGTGAVHLTTRQTIEIPGVAEADLPAACAALAAGGLHTAAGGPQVRSVVACPGRVWCRFGLIDGQALAARIAAHVRDRGALPHKFKIAIAGCPNGCAKPVENDFGLLGSGDGRCAVFVGGRMGRLPRLGNRLPVEIDATPEAVLRLLDATLDWYAAQAEPKERFGAALDRLGVDAFERAIETACPDSC